MRSFLYSALALFTLHSIALCQLVSYDAGEAGNPVVAPNPTSQGWGLTSSGGTSQTPISPDVGTGLNAWEVVDLNSGAFGTPSMVTRPMFPSSVNNSLYQRGLELTAVVRMLPGGTNGICFSWADGFTLSHNRYMILLQENGSDVIAHDWAGSGTYLCAGAMDGNYHHYAIRYVLGGPGMQFVYDGTVLGSVSGGIISPLYNDVGVFFGSSYSGGTGAARFNHVELRYQDDISTTYCSPASQNSTGSAAELTATGSVFVASKLLTLKASNLPQNQIGIFLNSQGQGLVVNPGGSQGNLCLGGASAIGRHNRPHEFGSSGSAGEIELSVDWNDLPGPNGLQIATAGQTWNFQCWYRDQNPGSTSNFSDAVSLTLQ